LRRAVPGQKGNKYQYIKEAYKAFKKGNYSNASIILEKASGAGIGDAYAVFLLALSYLYNEEFARSETALNRLEKIDPVYPPLVQLRAFLALKSSASSDEAVSSYISALEKISSDKTLKKSLGKIEKDGDFYKLQKNAKIADFVDIPTPGKGISRVKYGAGRGSNKKEAERIILNRSGIIFVSLFIVFIISASALYFYSDKVLEFIGYGVSSGKNISGSGKIDMIQLSGSGYGLVNKVNKEASPEFYISGDQVRNDFNRARSLIKKGEMNRAILILNRIMNSNSSFVVKEKTEFLIRFIIESDEREYEKIKYDEIMLKPYLYRGAAVLISGQAVNVRDSAKGTGLSILVDFDGKNFKGAIDAFSENRVQVKDGDIIEATGIFYPEVGRTKRPFISVVSLKVE
jgi:tetratricopeptide (TPR) repeat protein